VLPSSLSMQYESATNTAVFRFPTLPGGLLADGDYRFTLPANSVSQSGRGLTADFVYAFHVLVGDVNRDRAVDFNDLVPLARHYNVADGLRTWADGDLTGDGNVDFNDLVILAQRYNTKLPDPVTQAAPTALAADLAAAVAAMSTAPTPVAPKATKKPVEDRPEQPPVFSVTPVARPASAKPKVAAQRRRQVPIEKERAA
jgi:hypothetical protein